MRDFDVFKNDVAHIVFYGKVSPYIGRGWNFQAALKMGSMHFPFVSGFSLTCDCKNKDLDSFMEKYRERFENCKSIEEEKILLEDTINDLWQHCLDIIEASQEFGG